MGLKQKFLTDSPEKTKKLGEILAQSLMSSVLICLSGDLGSGKTTFAQGFAAGLGIKEKITSPSFVLMKKYKVPCCHCEESRDRRGTTKQSHHKKRIHFFYHLDCYRLRNSAEILAIGFEEILADPAGVVLVEWADKIQKYLPQGRIWIRFEVLGKRKREIIAMSSA